MQSIRGLWRAIPSTVPRHALFHYPCRSFTSSGIRRSIKQSSYEAFDAERPAALRKENKNRRENISQVQQTYGLSEDAEAVAEFGDSSTLGGSAKSKHDAQDLCSSVTASMAKLPHPAVVITTLDRTYNAQAAAGVPIEEMRHPIARGITVSSLTSLCIRPRPHVMFNMTLPSTMYEALVACKDFNVHILAPDEHGARVAGVFTRGNRLPSPRIGKTESSEYAFDADADLGVFAGLKEEGFTYAEIANRDAWHEQYQNAKESGLRASRSSQNINSTIQDSEHADPTRQVHHVPFLHSRGILEVLNCRLMRTIHPELPNAGQNVVMIGEVVDVTFPEQFNQTPVALGYADRKYRLVGDAIRHV
ncbi:hypothetical protein ANO14919_066970 [Xylariales sp. No.14919]|nr:hypothetical protein ANO14919_066970 [Xylariales sp. No.14919]